MPVATAANVRVSLSVPEGVYDQYAERAAKRGVDVLDEILTHLTRTRNWTDSTPIYLDNSARQTLSKIADKTLHNQQDVLDWARQSSSLTINGVKVELSSPLRAKIDAQRYRTPFKEFLPAKVTELLEHWLNLR